VEYSLILSIVAVALFAMQTHFKRGIQGILKVIADDMGPQGEPFRDFKEADIRRQELEAMKNHYNYAHQETYASSVTETKFTRSMGEGVILITTPENTVNSIEESYAVESEFQNEPKISQTSAPNLQQGSSIGKDNVQLSVKK
jgi:hypothetical protein